MKKNILKNQKGFTLIEIIAVLVILGILAAVAIPKYFSMQEAAADKVAEAGIASAYSALTMGKAAQMLGSSGYPATPTIACQGIKLEGQTIQSITCTSGTWVSGTPVPIVVTYTGGTSSPSKTRSWTAP